MLTDVLGYNQQITI